MKNAEVLSLQEQGDQPALAVIETPTEPEMITAFLGVFEQKLERSRKKLSKALNDKKEGKHDKDLVKATLNEAQKLKKHIKKLKTKVAKIESICPHCGKSIR